ncbi:tyrosinase family protein [Caballeronia sp. GAFFF1]|uniref:tyrosinase family protein n=1 Tax=Caballeronia sp. GAFFF1 TaxID=2921779 RepID=UPI0020283470|nr:tyrosinase family protein [Caballeronia sp. GAFFF1]
MAKNPYSRRTFLKSSASAAALMSLPIPGMTATTGHVRVEWQTFKTTPQYASFLNAIKLMKAVTDASKPTSWTYWVNVHLNYCPHMAPYFFAWHRGYLYYFEQQLRTVSGDSSLTLPYWDYYAHPTIPSEFLDSATGNPLYVSGRQNSNVYNALTMAPFSTQVNNFQRGTSNSYEASFENAPHNPVHDIIGGWMADMQSPTDPIFYLHHANVDRLFDGWAGLARTNYPSPTDSYWNGSFTYASGLTIAKSKTYQPSALGYSYANNSLPTSMPPSAQVGRIIRVQAQIPPIRTRPAIGNFSATGPRSIGNGRRSLGGVANLKLSEHSVSAAVSLASSDVTALQTAVTSTLTTPAATNANPNAQAAPGQAKFAKIVLDTVTVTSLGKQGGYFYNVYVNLPSAGDADPSAQARFVGTIGPFEVSAAMHHAGGTLMLPANDALRGLTPAELKQVVVSLVRVNGDNSPTGVVMSMNELRLELATTAD